MQAVDVLEEDESGSLRVMLLRWHHDVQAKRCKPRRDAVCASLKWLVQSHGWLCRWAHVGGPGIL